MNSRNNRNSHTPANIDAQSEPATVDAVSDAQSDAVSVETVDAQSDAIDAGDAQSDAVSDAQSEPASSELAAQSEPATPAVKTVRVPVKQIVSARMMSLISEHLDELTSFDVHDDPENNLRDAAVAFVSNYFSYAPGVKQNKIEWPSNFSAKTPLK